MNPRPSIRALLAAATMLAAGLAHADEGMVIWKNLDCGYFILQMKSGYGLYEWVGGPNPNDGDMIEGDLKAAGEHRVNNKTADVPTTIFLDSFASRRASISSRIPVRCKKPGQPAFETQ